MGINSIVGGDESRIAKYRASNQENETRSARRCSEILSNIQRTFVMLLRIAVMRQTQGTETTVGEWLEVPPPSQRLAIIEKAQQTNPLLYGQCLLLGQVVIVLCS